MITFLNSKNNLIFLSITTHRKFCYIASMYEFLKLNYNYVVNEFRETRTFVYPALKSWFNPQRLFRFVGIFLSMLQSAGQTRSTNVVCGRYGTQTSGFLREDGEPFTCGRYKVARAICYIVAVRPGHYKGPAHFYISSFSCLLRNNGYSK